MRKICFFPALGALCIGIAGYMLRRTQLHTVFNYVTGLSAPDADVSRYLLFLCFGFALLAFIFALVISKHYRTEWDYLDALKTGSVFPVFVISIAGLAILLSVAVLFYYDPSLLHRTYKVFYGAYLVMGILSFPALLLVFLGAYIGKPLKMTRPLSIAPILFFCLSALLKYIANNTNPAILSFAYPCIGYIAVSYGIFFMMGYVFKRPSVFCTVFFMMLGIFFTPILYADISDYTDMAIIIAAGAIQIFGLSIFIRNLKGKAYGKNR